MKNLLSITFFLLSLLTHSQETAKDSLIWRNAKSCDEGKESAHKDFKDGVYNSYSYGLLINITPKKSEVGFHDFYVNYMRGKYSINLEHRGCVITDYSACYSETMDDLISGKFGPDIFKRGRKEAKRLFRKK